MLTTNISAQTIRVMDNKGTIKNVDGSITNEIQDLQLVGNNLTITNNGTATTIDLSTYLDNTDNQQIETFAIDGSNVLTITLEDGGTKTVDLSPYLDNQTIDVYELNADGKNLDLSIEDDGEATKQVDLSNLLIAGDVSGTLGTSVVGKIQGIVVSATAPTNGQILAYNGTEWIPTTSSGTSGSGWGLTGNSGTNVNTNFLGTTDNQDLVFKVNNQNAGRIYTNGSLTLGVGSITNNANIVAIGGSSNVYGDGGVALGKSSSSTQNAVAAGLSANASGNNSVAIGKTSSSSGAQSIAIGLESDANGISGVAVGRSSNAGQQAIALGDNADSSALNGIAIGSATNVYGENGIALGNSAQAAQNSVALGANVNAYQSNTIVVGTNQNVGINLATPNSTLQVGGSVSMPIETVYNNFTLGDDDYTIILSGNYGYTITLPSASTYKGRMYVIKNPTNANKTFSTSIIIANGSTSNTISKKSVYQLQSDGSNWQRIN